MKRISIVAVVRFEFPADEDTEDEQLLQELRDRIKEAEYFPEDVVSVMTYRPMAKEA